MEQWALYDTEWEKPEDDRGEALKHWGYAISDQREGLEYEAMVLARIRVVQIYRRHMTSDADRARADRTIHNLRSQLL